MLEMVTAGAVKAPVMKGSIVKVLTGQQDLAVLTSTGNVYSLGTVNFTGTGSPSGNWVKLTDNVSQIVTAYRSVFLMKNDGTLWFIGSNNYFPAALGSTVTALTNVTSYFSNLLSGKTVKKIALSHTSLAVLCTDGTIILCGTNANGGMGVGSTTAQKSPARLSSITDVIDVAFDNGTMDTTYLLRQSGVVYAAGNSDYGQCGNLSTNNINFVQSTSNSFNITKVIGGSAGAYFFYRSVSTGVGNIGVMGRQFGGSLGTGATGNANYSTLTAVVTIPAASPDPEIVSGTYHARYWISSTAPYYTGTQGAFIGGGSVFNNTAKYSFTAMPVTSLSWEGYDCSKSSYANSYVVSGGNLYGAGTGGSLLPGYSTTQQEFVLLNTTGLN